MLMNGHGKYEEVADEKEFFEATKKSNNVVCLFYIPSNFRFVFSPICITINV